MSAESLDLIAHRANRLLKAPGFIRCYIGGKVEGESPHLVFEFDNNLNAEKHALKRQSVQDETHLKVVGNLFFDYR